MVGQAEIGAFVQQSSNVHMLLLDCICAKMYEVYSVFRFQNLGLHHSVSVKMQV